MRTPISISIICAFLLNTFGSLPNASAQEVYLPAPGTRVGLSSAFNPPVLKGIKVHPDNPFRLDFILDSGDETSFEAKGESALAKEALKKESTRLIKYFLASLTIPEKDLWVNLSPYEKDRIVPSSFGLTEMGRDLLAQDYLLKQITASLIYPEDEFGKKFWNRVYAEAVKKFGTTNIPVNTFNKVWIVPEKAVVYENAQAGTAYVVESKLKVMLEQDYLALEKGTDANSAVRPVLGQELGSFPNKDVNALGSQIVREIVIPQLTKEINENKNFSQLRQVYNSLILATWYKKKIKDSILNKVYSDKNKVSAIGLGTDANSAVRPILGQELASVPINVEHIYQQYLTAFKKGVYNYIKEEQDPTTQQIVPRKYFSGGMELLLKPDRAMFITSAPPNSTSLRNDHAMIIEVGVTSSVVESPLYEMSDVFQEAHQPDRAMAGLKQDVVADLSIQDGFPENPISHNNEQFRARLEEFIREHDAKHHLIDGSDPQFQDLYNDTREILDTLIKTAGLDPSKIRLFFSDEDAANAFYLRGSNVFVVNIGLLKLQSKNAKITLSKDAIGFILAHEVLHLIQYRDDVANGKFDPNMQLNPKWEDMARERKQRYLDEYDADWKAIDLMSRAGFNVREAPRIFRILLEKLLKRKSVKFLPFGDHPQLEPRTIALENLVLGRYWPNTLKPPTSFLSTVRLATSRFRDFQERVLRISSDKEFTQLITEAQDIRELAVAISIGAERWRNSSIYKHNESSEQDESAILELAEFMENIKSFSVYTDTGSEYATQLSEAISRYPSRANIPEAVLMALQAQQNSLKEYDFKYRRKSKFTVGDLLRLQNGEIIVLMKAELLPGNMVEIFRLTNNRKELTNFRELGDAKTISVQRKPDARSTLEAPLHALSVRINELGELNPSKKLQFRFYEELFKRNLNRSNVFSQRTQRRTGDFILVKADPREFDELIKNSTMDELFDMLEGLIPVWIDLEGNSKDVSAYDLFLTVMDGGVFDKAVYEPGDFIEMISAISRKLIDQIQKDKSGRLAAGIPRLIFLFSNCKFPVLAHESIGKIRKINTQLAHLYTKSLKKLKGAPAETVERNAQDLTNILDSLNLLEYHDPWMRLVDDFEGEKQPTAKDKDIARLLYEMYKNPQIKKYVISLFQKHIKVDSPVKKAFYQILIEDKTISLDEKLFVIDELGRDYRGLQLIAGILLHAETGEGDKYVNSIINEITSQYASLSKLKNSFMYFKRLVVLIYLGGFESSGRRIFNIYDLKNRHFVLSTDEIRLFYDFIKLDFPLKRLEDFLGPGKVVRVNSDKQLALSLSLLGFLEKYGQNEHAFRFLLNLGSTFPNFNRELFNDQHKKDMRTFSMFMGEFLERPVDSLGFSKRAPAVFRPEGYSSYRPEGYSLWDMAERLESTRPQRFGRWDLMIDEEKDHLDYFSFLDKIYEHKTFQESVQDIAENFPESVLRDMMIYILFVKKIVHAKLGIDFSSDNLFDFNWIRQQVNGRNMVFREELQVALAYIGWDRDIQKLNVAFLTEVSDKPPSIDQHIYDDERPSYTDARFYDVGGADSQIALFMASLDEGYLKEFIDSPRPLVNKRETLFHYFRLPSSYRDKYVLQILEGTLRDLENGLFESTPEIEAQVVETLKAFQNISLRERLAVRFLEFSLSYTQKQNGSLTLETERDAILRYLPDFSFTRDEVLNQFVNRQVKTTKQYRAVADLFVRNLDNIRKTESADHLFWKEQVRDVFMNFDPGAKARFLMWLIGVGEKPEAIKKEEYRLHISFDGLKESFGLHSGQFYNGIGKQDQKEFFNSLFLGNKGIFSDQESYVAFLDQLLAGLIPAERKSLTAIFLAVLTTPNRMRRQNVLLGLLQNYKQLKDMPDGEEKEAKAIRIFLKANGLLGDKLSQFLAHSGLVKSGSPLQRELQGANYQGDPLDKGILFDMLEKIHDGRAFEDVYESLDEVRGVGSIAQVNKAIRKDGSKRAPKFKKPHVENSISDDSVFFDGILNRISPILEEEDIPVPAGLVSRFKEGLEDELDFGDTTEEGTGEANKQRRLKKNMAHRGIKTRDGVTYEFVVPVSDAVHGNSLIDQEFAEGIPLKEEQALRDQGVDIDVIKELLMEELIQQFFVDGFYHADLQSGNVLVQKMGTTVRVSFIDVGAAYSISAANREILVGILMAFWDKDNWQENKETVYRLFPQIQDASNRVEELDKIVQSDDNPIQKLLSFFVLLEKRNIQFQDNFKEFYSVMRFLKASEYLFSNAILENVKERFFPSNIDAVKSQVSAITTEIKREFSTVQAPEIKMEAGKGLRVVVTTETMVQVHEALKNLKALPFWSTISQIDQLVDLILGVLVRSIEREEDLELMIPEDKMPVYQDIKSDVEFLVSLIQQESSIGVSTMISALTSIRRIASKQDVIFDVILQQNIPINEIIESLKPIAGSEAAERLRDALETRRLPAKPSIRPDSAMLGEKGGIDFNADKVDKAFAIKHSGGEIKFHIDPAMLEQLQNAPGFIPVIINIRPMNNIREFLGLSRDTESSRMVGV